MKVLKTKFLHSFSELNLWRKLFFLLLVILILAVIAFLLFRELNHENNLIEGQYKTTTVTKGNVFSVVEATGEVAAENEVLLLCPYTSIVKHIVRLPGANVKKGEVIMSLDITGIEKRIEDLQDELEVLNNNLLKLTLSSQSIKIDLSHDMEVKKLNILSLESELEDLEALLEVGGTSQAKLDKTKQALLLAKKELDRASSKHNIKLKQLEADEKGLNLQIQMKEKDLKEMLAIKDKMLIVAPGKGVILEVKARTGEIVKENSVLVRISEHTRLKVVAEIPDKYQNEMHNGGKVFVLTDKGRLEGTIGNISPEIEDDKIKFEVFLKEPQNSNLRVNKKVDLLVVTDERSDVLRIKNEMSFLNSRQEECYVIQDNKAFLKNIQTGLIGIDYIEITKGLDSGSVVIVSDLPVIKKRNVIEIKRKSNGDQIR